MGAQTTILSTPAFQLPKLNLMPPMWRQGDGASV